MDCINHCIFILKGGILIYGLLEYISFSVLDISAAGGATLETWLPYHFVVTLFVC